MVSWRSWNSSRVFWTLWDFGFFDSTLILCLWFDSVLHGLFLSKLCRINHRTMWMLIILWLNLTFSLVLMGSVFINLFLTLILLRLRVQIVILNPSSNSVSFIHIVKCFNRVVIIVTWTHLVIILCLGNSGISLLEIIILFLILLIVSCTFHLSFNLIIIINLIWFLKFNLFENFIIRKIFWKWIRKITIWRRDSSIVWPGWFGSLRNINFRHFPIIPKRCFLLSKFLFSTRNLSKSSLVNLVL